MKVSKNQKGLVTDIYSRYRYYLDRHLNYNEMIIVNDIDIRIIIQYEVKRLGYYADLNHIDTSNVTHMRYTFNASTFNGNISKWNVSKVTEMTCMFVDSKFNGDISKWDVSNVTEMSGMFLGSKFNGNLSLWNFNDNCTIMAMFSDEYIKQSNGILYWVEVITNDIEIKDIDKLRVYNAASNIIDDEDLTIIQKAKRLNRLYEESKIKTDMYSIEF